MSISDARQLVDQAIVQLQQHSDEKQVLVTGGHQVVSPQRTNAWQEGKFFREVFKLFCTKSNQLQDGSVGSQGSRMIIP